MGWKSNHKISHFFKVLFHRIWKIIFFSGVLANEAKITLLDFPDDLYCDWPKENVTITHRAATTWPRTKLQNEWNRMVQHGIEIFKQHYDPQTHT